MERNGSSVKSRKSATYFSTLQPKKSSASSLWGLVLFPPPPTTSRSHLLPPLYAVFPSDRCSFVYAASLQQTNPSKCSDGQQQQSERVGPACEKMERQPEFFIFIFFPLYMMFSSGDRWLLRHFSHFTLWVCLLCIEAWIQLKQTHKLGTHTFCFF